MVTGIKFEVFAIQDADGVKLDRSETHGGHDSLVLVLETGGRVMSTSTCALDMVTP